MKLKSPIPGVSVAAVSAFSAATEYWKTAVTDIEGMARLQLERGPFKDALEAENGISSNIMRSTPALDAAPATDKVRQNYFCSAAGLLALFTGLEFAGLEDREHEKPGSWHWHLTLEKL